MPAKNVVKSYREYSYYHVYNRGVAKQAIFLDQSDKRYFLGLVDRHLNPDSNILDRNGVPYKKYDQMLELLCYCLMKNHFHLLIYMGDSREALQRFMKSIGVAYTMYFNLKYKRVGPIFQGTFKACRIDHDDYLLHITRYIHLNPRQYEAYRYSSLLDYAGKRTPAPWLKVGRILDLFDGDRQTYAEFVADYKENRDAFEIIKHNLADL